MPKIAEIEYTPNPNAVKFVLKEPVTAGFPRAFRDREMAEYDALAKGLFAVDHVVSVYMQDKFITVTKDDGIGWTELLPKLAPPIRQAPSAAGDGPAGSPHWEAPQVDDHDPFVQQVREALATSILPALAADGGGLDVVGRHDKQIMIRYQGACSSCPSGLTGTLMAIEGILRKEVDPEIVVVSV
jgi:Fe-S cluster biogenesis protein NfuA